MSSAPRHLCGLDALRGIASLFVVLWHVLYLKQRFGLDSHPAIESLPLVHQGHAAVTFFFVLSGFLITYLLLCERAKTGTTDIGAFYARRVLRIWPVYYLCLAIGMVIPGLIDSLRFSPEFFSFTPANIAAHTLLLPNLAPAENPLCFQSWSIGVEEQFYLAWPILFVLGCTSDRRTVATMLGVCLLIYGLRACHLLWTDDTTQSLRGFLGRARFDNMAIGGLFGLAYYRSWLPQSKWLAAAAWTTTLCMRWLLYSPPAGLEHLVYALLFAVSIYYVVVFVRPASWLEQPFLRFVGKVSYGIYMYHVCAIYAALNIVSATVPEWPTDTIAYDAVLYPLAVLITVVLSWLSYVFLERPFLGLKRRFTAAG